MKNRIKQRLRKMAPNLVLLCASFVVCFSVVEICYRVFDPFPYFPADENNATEHGNLSQYDPILGWKGVPEGRAEFVTTNSRTHLANNKQGFRDIEHDDADDARPAIVFLGDSFTWGYEVEFDEMFVNRLREWLADYTVFNLAHRGYGTDQSLLTFKQWHSNNPLRLVVLMFCENDVGDNNSTLRYAKRKPKYQLVDNKLVLTGIPVPDSSWRKSRMNWEKPSGLAIDIKDFLLRSHFLHDVFFRTKSFIKRVRSNGNVKEGAARSEDITLTSQIMRELKKEVERRGAELVVFFIPSKIEIERLLDLPPYQVQVAEICPQLRIRCYDLAPHFSKLWRRTYFRTAGMHWNPYGHQVAAEAIYEHLGRDVLPELSDTVPRKGNDHGDK